MSADPRDTAVRYAEKYGVPYLYRCGTVLILVERLAPLKIESKQAQNTAAAREFQRRAIRESGWKGNRS